MSEESKKELSNHYSELLKTSDTNPMEMLRMLMGELEGLPKMTLLDEVFKTIGIQAAKLAGGTCRMFGFSGEDIDKMAREIGWPEGDYHIAVAFIAKGVKPMGRLGHRMTPTTFSILVSVRVLKYPEAEPGKREYVQLENGFSSEDGEVCIPSALRNEALALLNELNGYIQEGSLHLSEEHNGSSRIVYKRAFQLPYDDTDKNALVMGHVIDCAEKYLVRAIPSLMKLGTTDIKTLEQQYKKQEAEYQQTHTGSFPGMGDIIKSVANGGSFEDFEKQLRASLDAMSGQKKEDQQENEQVEDEDE